MADQEAMYRQRAEMLRALAHPVRLRIVRGLLECGCRNVKCMEQATGQSQPAISQHLYRLKQAGVLECDRRGNQVYYRVADARVEGLVRVLFEGEEADCIEL